MSLVQKAYLPQMPERRNCMSYRNIGIDLGVTARHQAQVFDEVEKKIVISFSFHTSKQDMDTLCQKALSTACQGTKLRFICEPTEMSWLPLAIYAKTHNYEIARVKSHKAHDLNRYFARHKKNDKFDARSLSVMPLIDQKAVEPVYLPNAKLFALERYNKQSKKITDEIAAIKNRLSSLFHWVMPGSFDCFDDKFGSRARAFYRNFANPFKAKKSNVKGICKILKPACRQKMDNNLPEKLYSVILNAYSLYENASSYVDFTAVQDEVNIELELLEAQEKILEKVKKRVKDLYQQVHPSKNIETLKGVAETLGPSFIGIIGNPQRFSSQSKLRCFTGIIPKQDESGETNKKGLSICQEGPSRFRRDLFLAADVARQWDPQLAKVYYDDMVHKGNCHNHAVLSVATKLVNRILCVLKENRPYELRDTAGKVITASDAKRMIKQSFTVPEEIRKRTRSRKSLRNKKEEHLHDLVKRQLIASQNSRSIPPERIIQNLEKPVKSVS